MFNSECGNTLHIKKYIMKTIDIAEREYQRQMRIREFGYELLSFLKEHSTVYKVEHNLSEVWDEDSLLPNKNPKYLIVLKGAVSSEITVEIDDFINRMDSRISYIVEEYASNVIEIEGIYY